MKDTAIIKCLKCGEEIKIIAKYDKPHVEIILKGIKEEMNGGPQ